MTRLLGPQGWIALLRIVVGTRIPAGTLPWGVAIADVP